MTNGTRQLIAAVVFLGMPGYLYYCYNDVQKLSKKTDVEFVAKNHDYYAAFCKSWPEQACCQRNSDECSPAGVRVVAGR